MSASMSPTHGRLSVLGQKRIAFYTDDPGEGGVAIYTHVMACALARAGLNVTIIQSKMEGPLQETQRELGVNHWWLPFATRTDANRMSTDPRDAQEAFAAVRPDVVVFANCDPFSNIAAKVVAIQQGLPYVIVEGYVYPIPAVTPMTAWHLHFATDHYARAKAVVAVSKNNLSLLRKYFGLAKRKGEIIHYGRPDEYFRPPDPALRESLRRQLQVGPQDVLCLTIGRLAPVKGYDCLLAALEQLRTRPIWKDLHFVWVGGGTLQQQLLDSLEKMGIANRVHLLGHRWDVLNWLDASDVFILPSRCEGMPISIMEAMAKGLPVMASAVSGIPEELGPTGRQLTIPDDSPEPIATEIVTTLEAWARDAELRRSLGQAGKARAELMFREERMVEQTTSVIERALLPKGDYVSPGLECIRPDACFPHMVAANPKGHARPHLRWEIPHTWYHDSRAPGTGFANRDEAHILYNTALAFRGRRALEIGCWLGWSTCHLALAGVVLDVIDPVLARADFGQAVQESLAAAGVQDRVNLVAGESPAAVEELARSLNVRWSLFFIDGDHERLGPVFDAAVCTEFAEPDALVLFHDLAAPDVAGGLEYLRRRGWNTLIYSTMQIMGAAWRGNVRPITHYPDPDVAWSIPQHLRDYVVSGM